MKRARYVQIRKSPEAGMTERRSIQTVTSTKIYLHGREFSADTHGYS